MQGWDSLFHSNISHKPKQSLRFLQSTWTVLQTQNFKKIWHELSFMSNCFTCLSHIFLMNFWSSKPQGRWSCVAIWSNVKSTFFSSSSCYSTHDYNFEYVCLCFLLYFFVARKVVMFMPPHIIWSRAHRGGLSSVSFWLHHCKLWKEEEEVVVHNLEPLLFTFFGGFLIDDDNDTRRSAPPLDHFFHLIIVDDDNKRRMFKLIFWFCFLVISCKWWWQEEEHGIPSRIFLFLHLYMDRKNICD